MSEGGGCESSAHYNVNVWTYGCVLKASAHFKARSYCMLHLASTICCLQVLAALVHDVNHSGHNNAFHVASSSELALLYSDQVCVQHAVPRLCWYLVAYQSARLSTTAAHKAECNVHHDLR